MTDDAGDASPPSSAPPRAGRRPRPLLVAALVGLALVGAGIVTVLAADAQSGARDALAEVASVQVSDSVTSVAYLGSWEPWMDGNTLWLTPDPGVMVGLLLAAAGVAVVMVTSGWWIGSRRRRRSGAVPAVLTALGVALVVAGAVTMALTPPVTFGWFAYAPLTRTAIVPMPVQPMMLLGQLLASAGTAALMAVAGWLCGRWVAHRRQRGRPLAGA